MTNPLSDGKMQSFSVGKQKKTRFQKDKEAAEAKRVQADAEAASLYEEFAASFDPSESLSTGGKTFVQTGGGVYKPDVKPLSEMEKMVQEMKNAQARRGRRDSDPRDIMKVSEEKDRAPSSSSDAAIKKREMDAFLDEIKQRQEFDTPSGSSLPFEMSKGSMDDGDPSSTNLYIGFVAPTITEERLQGIFGEFGEIYSIKIMWPRSDEEKARRRNCGFVSFWRRADAEAAKEAMQGKDIDGMEIQIGWGKPINKLAHGIGDETKISENPNTSGTTTGLATQPNIAMNIPTHLPALLSSTNGVPTSVHTARAVAVAAVAAVNASLAQPPPLPVQPERDMMNSDFRIEVIMPQAKERRYMIDRTARYVAKDGAQFESKIIQNEMNNPDFNFLTNIFSEEGKYYRWRAYSFAMGDREKKWRLKPFQMFPNGPFWVPPPEPDYDSTDSEEERERDRQRERDRRREKREKDSKFSTEKSSDTASKETSKPLNDRYKYATGRQLEKARMAERDRGGGGRLPSREEDKLWEFLGKLTSPTRSLIREIMGLALDNSECSGHVVEILSDSLVSTEADLPPSTIVGRLYVLSDILHNSAAPVRNATSYRTLLQGELPRVFESVGGSLRKIGGRLTARQLQEKVLELIKVWSDWSIYPPLFLTGLEASFMRTNADMETVASATRSENVKEEDIDRAALERKARQAGLFVAEQMGALELFNRLNHLNAYVKAKSAGRSLGEIHLTNMLGEQSEGSSTDVDGVPLDMAADTEVEESEDEDIDGVPLEVSSLPPPPPLPVPPLLADIEVSTKRSRRNSRSSSPNSSTENYDTKISTIPKKSRWD